MLQEHGRRSDVILLVQTFWTPPFDSGTKHFDSWPPTGMATIAFMSATSSADNDDDDDDVVVQFGSRRGMATIAIAKMAAAVTRAMLSTLTWKPGRATKETKP